MQLEYHHALTPEADVWFIMALAVFWVYGLCIQQDLACWSQTHQRSRNDHTQKMQKTHLHFISKTCLFDCWRLLPIEWLGQTVGKICDSMLLTSLVTHMWNWARIYSKEWLQSRSCFFLCVCWLHPMVSDAMPASK